MWRNTFDYLFYIIFFALIILFFGVLVHQDYEVRDYCKTLNYTNHEYTKTYFQCYNEINLTNDTYMRIYSKEFKDTKNEHTK